MSKNRRAISGEDMRTRTAQLRSAGFVTRQSGWAEYEALSASIAASLDGDGPLPDLPEPDGDAAKLVSRMLACWASEQGYTEDDLNTGAALTIKTYEHFSQHVHSATIAGVDGIDNLRDDIGYHYGVSSYPARLAGTTDARATEAQIALIPVARAYEFTALCAVLGHRRTTGDPRVKSEHFAPLVNSLRVVSAEARSLAEGARPTRRRAQRRYDDLVLLEQLIFEQAAQQFIDDPSDSYARLLLRSVQGEALTLPDIRHGDLADIKRLGDALAGAAAGFHQEQANHPAVVTVYALLDHWNSLALTLDRLALGASLPGRLALPYLPDPAVIPFRMNMLTMPLDRARVVQALTTWSATVASDVLTGYADIARPELRGVLLDAAHTATARAHPCFAAIVGD